MKKSLIIPLLMAVGLSMQGVHAVDQPVEAAKVVELSKYESKNYDSLLGHVKGLDDALLKMHFKLYQGYVLNTNAILQKLQELTTAGQSRTPEFAALKRILGWEFDGMVLHELYFDNLSGGQPLKSDDPLYAKMTRDFGSYDKWKADFISTGLIRGIGWVVAYIDPKDGRLINTWINEHDLGHLAGGTPILIMDVFEHAYITQFGLDRNKYIEVFFDNINWGVVSKRYAERKESVKQ